ncbi:MAG: TraB/GumN family protein [Kofleriaceae bacterium]
MKALLIFLVACASAPKCELPAVTAGAPLLWKVHKADGPVIYFYGTIHVAGISAVPPAALQALDQSKQFASELGDKEPDMDKLTDLARLPYGQVLDRQLPDDDWYDLVDALRGTMKEDDLRHARPWFAMTRLTNKLAESPKPSMDESLTDRAHGKMPVDALETWDAQMQALVDGVSIQDLQQAIHERKKLACDVALMRRYYENGDDISLAPMLVARDQATIIDARNAKWRAQIETYATTSGAFIAVGLGHLLGDRGLLSTFRTSGYTVERAERSR